MLLAYDSSKLSAEDAPKNWKELTAWIKANPGQFIYNPPDKAAPAATSCAAPSGQRARPLGLHRRRPYRGTRPGALEPAWDLLADLAPHLYDGGAYTSGNTQSVQLLAQGVATMVPVWSPRRSPGTARNSAV